jgi:tetratricopeptide (TPR) repeat protein
MPTRSSHKRPEIIAITFLILVWITAYAGFFFQDFPWWGFNHLVFLSSAFIFVHLTLGLLAFLTFIPFVGRRVLGGYETISELIMARRRYLIWAIIAGLSALVFWFLRMPTHFLGDGLEVISNVSEFNPVIHKWTETWSIRLIHFIAGLLPYEGDQSGEYAYGIVSVVSGSITLFTFFILAYELGTSTIDRLFIFCLLSFAGWMLLFFGYAENYPIIWPFVASYLIMGIRYIKGKCSLIWPMALLILLIMLHLQMFFYALSCLPLFVCRGIGAKAYRKNRRLVWIIFAVVAISCMALSIIKYVKSISFSIHFLPPFTGRPATPDYAIFSLEHLMDIVNEWRLLIPLLPFLLIMGLWQWKSTRKDSIGHFLAWFSVGGIIMLLILDPKLGMIRDWDLFALTGLGPCLYLSRRVLISNMLPTNLLPALSLLALVLTFPFVATNVSYQPSIDYFRYALEQDPERSRPGFALLRGFYQYHNQPIQAKSIHDIIDKRFPEVKLYQQAHDWLNKGYYNQSMTLAQSLIRKDPYSGEGYYLRGLNYLHQNNPKAAISDLGLVLELSPYDYLAHLSIARAYEAIGQHRQMMEHLRKTQDLRPNGIVVLQALSMAFLKQNRYDSSLTYALKLLDQDQNNFTGHLAAGVSFARMGMAQKGKEHLIIYLNHAPDGPESQNVRNLLNSLE